MVELSHSSHQNFTSVFNLILKSLQTAIVSLQVLIIFQLSRAMIKQKEGHLFCCPCLSTDRLLESSHY